MDFKRLKTHLNETTDGKIFIGFLSLILRSHLITCIDKIPKKKRPSSKVIMRELKKIRLLEFSSKTKILLPLTARQKDFLTRFGVEPDKLEINASTDFSSLLGE